MSKFETNKGLISKDAEKRLDISINVSHNRSLSNRDIIRLVKLLARQAAEEDFRAINNHSKSRQVAR